MKYLILKGPREEEKEMKISILARDKYWKEKLRCPDGFISPHDKVHIEDNVWKILDAETPPKIGAVIKQSRVEEDMYNDMGAFERCYHYFSSVVIKAAEPYTLKRAEELGLELHSKLKK